MTTADIDLNVRCGPTGTWTYVGFEDMSGPYALGEWVDVVEPESGVYGRGQVVEIDRGSQIVYIDVKWKHLKTP